MFLWRNVCNLCLNSHGVQGLPNSFDSSAVDFLLLLGIAEASEQEFDKSIFFFS
jgi:hypothetical protein